MKQNETKIDLKHVERYTKLGPSSSVTETKQDCPESCRARECSVLNEKKSQKRSERKCFKTCLKINNKLNP